MSSSDRPPETAWNQFSIDQISILIRLHRLLSAIGPYERAIEDLLEPLGFGPNVAHALAENYQYQYKVRDILAQTLETLKAKYQNLYNIHDDDIDSQDIHQAMFGGLLSLKNLTLLKNPFAVAKVESDLKLPVTGDIRFFQKNWNHTYYSRSRCGEFNDPRTCMEKAAKYGDIDEFIRLYPEFEKLNIMLKREVVFSVVSAGQIDILEYIIQRLGDGFEDLIKFNEIIVSAAKVAFDNTRMLDYIYTMFEPDLVGRWTAVGATMRAYGGIGANTHINNIKYLLSQIPDEELRRRVVNPLKYIIKRGWDDYFKELASRLQISPDRWDMLLPNAIVSGNQDLIDFIKPHISPNFDYANVLLASPDNLTFKRVLALPEVTRDVILRYLRQFHHFSPIKHTTTLDLILESGKVSQEDINNIH